MAGHSPPHEDTLTYSVQTILGHRLRIAAWCLSGLFLIWPGKTTAQLERPVFEVYDSVSRSGSDYLIRPATLFANADSAAPIISVRSGEPVHRLRRAGEWSKIRLPDGTTGYIRHDALADVWLYVSKNRNLLFAFRGKELLHTLPVDLAISVEDDKVRRGSWRNPDDWRTPEGLFYISRKNEHSRFHRALVISFPSPKHAQRAVRTGLISRSHYADIVKANLLLRNPPMTTHLGGWIELHGDGIQGRGNWTHGCIALENEDIDVLWDIVGVGTPIVIEPFTRRHISSRPRLVEHRLPGASSHSSAPVSFPTSQTQ